MTEDEISTVAVGYNDDPTKERIHYQTFLIPHTDFGQDMLEKFKEVGRDFDKLVRRKDALEDKAKFGNEKFKAGIKKERENTVQLIKKRLSKQEERIEELNGLDQVNLNDAKARKQELEELLEEIEE